MFNFSSRASKIAYSIIASIILLLLWSNMHAVAEAIGLKSPLPERLARDLFVVIAGIVLTAIAIKPRNVFSFLGLNGNIAKGFGIAILCVIPIYLAFIIFGQINTDTTFSLVARKSILSGFVEEFMFRAIMFGLLFRYAKIGFFWSVILPALCFGAMHLYQGHDAASSLAAFGVTFLGAVYFSWMYAEWDFNLWVPVGLHMLMNAAWVVFTMEGTEAAAGGLVSNIARVTGIVLAIALTIWHKKRHGIKFVAHTQMF